MCPEAAVRQVDADAERLQVTAQYFEDVAGDSRIFIIFQRDLHVLRRFDAWS